VTQHKNSISRTTRRRSTKSESRLDAQRKTRGAARRAAKTVRYN
jgi:hypothetical protein